MVTITCKLFVFIQEKMVLKVKNKTGLKYIDECIAHTYNNIYKLEYNNLENYKICKNLHISIFLYIYTIK